jgi:hypothetical protein
MWLRCRLKFPLPIVVDRLQSSVYSKFPVTGRRPHSWEFFSYHPHHLSCFHTHQPSRVSPTQQPSHVSPTHRPPIASSARSNKIFVNLPLLLTLYHQFCYSARRNWQSHCNDVPFACPCTTSPVICSHSVDPQLFGYLLPVIDTARQHFLPTKKDFLLIVVVPSQQHHNALTRLFQY